MKFDFSLRYFLRLYFERRVSEFLVPLFSAAIFVFVFFLIRGVDLTSDEMGELMGNMLKVVGSFLTIALIGISLYAGRAVEIEDTESALAEVEQFRDFLFEGYAKFGNSRRARYGIKQLHYPFLRRLLVGVRSNSFTFKVKDKRKWRSLFMYRPYLDGVWYHGYEWNVGDIRPEGNIPDEYQFKLHEALFCSIQSLYFLSRNRKKGLYLITERRGSNGSRWFLEAFKKIESRIKYAPRLRHVNVSAAEESIKLLIKSIWYTDEELKRRTEEFPLSPEKEFQFFLNYVQYIRWMGEFIDKVNQARDIRLKRRQSKVVAAFYGNPDNVKNLNEFLSSIKEKYYSLTKYLGRRLSRSEFLLNTRLRGLLSVCFLTATALGLTFSVLAKNLLPLKVYEFYFAGLVGFFGMTVFVSLATLSYIVAGRLRSARREGEFQF